MDNQIYYACTATACQPTTVPSLTSQVANPVTLFATDNNGVIVQLPSVAAQGAATVTGSMIFGIDTQSNNKSGSQTILTVDPSAGDFTTVFDGQTFSESFLDTGSNGTFFNDSNITQCTASGGLTDFYCPASTQNFSATLQGQNSVSVSETFSVGDAQSFSGDDAALPLLAGPFRELRRHLRLGPALLLRSYGLHRNRECLDGRRHGTLRRILGWLGSARFTGATGLPHAPEAG